MADNVVLNSGSGGETLATDDIGGVQHQRIKIEYGVDGSATDISHTNPLPGILGLVTPTTSYSTSVAVTASTSDDLDSTQITSGKTGELVAIAAGGSVPTKIEIKTVLNGVASGVLFLFFSQPGVITLFTLPSKKFITQVESASAGLDGFRATITNLDANKDADLYATFFYDEV